MKYHAMYSDCCSEVGHSSGLGEFDTKEEGEAAVKKFMDSLDEESAFYIRSTQVLSDEELEDEYA